MIYAASDLHGKLVAPPDDATAIILGGDICPDFMATARASGAVDPMPLKGAPLQADWLNTDFRNWLNSFSHIPVYAIWGNHDFVGEHPDLIPNLRWNLLEDSEASLVDEVGERIARIYGTPWVPGLPYWAFYAPERALVMRAEAIPDGLDILISHGPPLRAGDYIPTSDKQRNKYGNYGGENAGDAWLAAAIRRVRPKVTICGHIHEARGRHWLSGNRVLNVSALDERYQPRDPFWTRVAFDEKPYSGS